MTAAGRTFVDTNVLLYAHDASEIEKQPIARALLGEPSLLLCDEPTGNLDTANTESVLDLFDDLREQGLTILVITHDSEVAERAQRRVRMVDGRLTEVA